MHRIDHDSLHFSFHTATVTALVRNSVSEFNISIKGHFSLWRRFVCPLLVSAQLC